MKSLTPEISLALPCYNERDQIQEVVRQSAAALESLGRSWEILVVDNHSSDGTPEKVAPLCRLDRRVRLVVHEANRLYSGSCATALRECRGRYSAIMDSDGQFSALDLPKFLAHLERGVNLVFGWRRRRIDPWARKAMSAVFNLLGSYYLDFPFHDLNVGLRMFDRRFQELARVEKAINMANPELYVRARQAGLRMAEVPIRHFGRTVGKSSHDFRRLIGLFRQVVDYFQSLSRDLAPEKLHRQGDREELLPMNHRAA